MFARHAKAEINENGIAFFIDDDVFGLEVAEEIAAFVDMLFGGKDMQRDGDSFLFAKLPEACDPFVKPFAGNEFHDGEIFVVVIARIQTSGDEFGIFKLFGDMGFVQQRQNVRRIGPFVSRKDFHGEKMAWILRRDGFIDGPHAATAGRFIEIVVFDFLRCEKTGVAFRTFIELHEFKR